MLRSAPGDYTTRVVLHACLCSSQFCCSISFVVGKMSASYFALISWLLSLVAMDTGVVEGPDSGSVPFHVIGLQQMVLDGQLTLHAAIVPIKRFTSRDLRSRSKVICRGGIVCLFCVGFLVTMFVMMLP